MDIKRRDFEEVLNARRRSVAEFSSDIKKTNLPAVAYNK
jgi:hypothetical protein